MNGNKLYEELFTMNSERTETKKNLLKLFKSIDWSEYKKYGFDVNSKKTDSVEFAVYKNYEMEPECYDKIKGFITEWMPEICKDDDWGNLIYRCLSKLSSDDVLKKHLKNESGIYFYSDYSSAAYITITKEGLEQL